MGRHAGLEDPQHLGRLGRREFLQADDAGPPHERLCAPRRVLRQERPDQPPAAVQRLREHQRSVRLRTQRKFQVFEGENHVAVPVRLGQDGRQQGLAVRVKQRPGEEAAQVNRDKAAGRDANAKLRGRRMQEVRLADAGRADQDRHADLAPRREARDDFFDFLGPADRRLRLAFGRKGREVRCEARQERRLRVLGGARPGHRRLVTTADYGCGAPIWKYAADAPEYSDYANRPSASTDSCLVTRRTYDAAGRLKAVFDPKGIETRTYYDDIGRKTYVVENYTDFDAEKEEDSGGADKSQDRVTRFTYDGLGNVRTQTALDPDADGDTKDSQTTTYDYTDAHSASLQTKVTYPDSTAGSDVVSVTYHLDGLPGTRTNQAGLVLTYRYDGLRRKTGERVTDWYTSPADRYVEALATAYDSLGRVEKLTAHTGDYGTVRCQIQYSYDFMSRLAREYQHHTGEVDTQTTPYVEYHYDSVRLIDVRYPNNSYILLRYGDAGGVPDKLSQLVALWDSHGGSYNPVAEFAYCGVSRLVTETHSNSGNLVQTLSYAGPTAGQYPHLDRFGRITWQTWKDANDVVIDQYFYGYDTAGNRLWRAVRPDPYALMDLDEAYQYDGLHRLTKAQRGSLTQGPGPIAPCYGDTDVDGDVDDDDADIVDANYGKTGMAWADGDFDGNGKVDDDDVGGLGGIYGSLPDRSVVRTWQWTLDSVGNWAGYYEDAGAGGEGQWDLQQSRTHNKANEIDTDNSHSNGPDEDAIDEGESQAKWVGPKYDAAGNLIQGPKPASETARLHFVYDAWNRLVQVREDSGGKAGDPIATYRHDAAGRRIRKLLGANPAEPTLALDYYHNNTGQVVEVRKDGAANPLEQYLWSPRYVHAPVVRWRDENTDGDLLDQGDTVLYYCTDANFNVTLLMGSGIERYMYDPYGKVEVLDGGWTPREGNASAYSNELLFTGHRLDTESGLYYTLHRHYHPTLGRWLQRDPQGYVDGMGLYEYCGGGPLDAYDPLGLLELPTYTETYPSREKGKAGTITYEYQWFTGRVVGRTLFIPDPNPNEMGGVPVSRTSGGVDCAAAIYQKQSDVQTLGRSAGYVRSGMEGVLSLHPLENILEAGAGTDINNNPTGIGDRALNIAGLLPVGAVLGTAGKITVKGARALNLAGDAARGAARAADVAGDAARTGRRAGRVAREAAAADSLRTVTQAAGTGPQYFIENGVRRSVASREAGLTEIPATVYREGQAPVTTTLRLDQLHSPKPEVLLDARLQRIKPPIVTPIEVQPLGLPGQVQTVPLGRVRIVPPERQ